MPTAFRTTAIAPDSTGRYRTSIVLASISSRNNGFWSEESIAKHIERERLPTIALYLTVSEYQEYLNGTKPRFGYVDKAGDTETAFDPFDWHKSEYL